MSILKHQVFKSMGSFRSALFALTVTLGLSVPVRAEVPQITLHRDIVFETIDGVELKLDLATSQQEDPQRLDQCQGYFQREDLSYVCLSLSFLK